MVNGNHIFFFAALYHNVINIAALLSRFTKLCERQTDIFILTLTSQSFIILLLVVVLKILLIAKLSLVSSKPHR